MDIPRPDNFNETYLYEGMWTKSVKFGIPTNATQNSWSVIWQQSSDLASL